MEWMKTAHIPVSRDRCLTPAEPRTLDGPVGHREYCLGCRREVMTESGHLCPSCSGEKVEATK